MAFIVRKQVGHHREIYEISGDVLSLGSGQTCQLRLNDPRAGLLHAELRDTPDGFTIFDNDSPTGTFVNGSRLEKSKVLGDGDQIGIGSVSIAVSASDDRRVLTLAFEAPPSVSAGTDDNTIDYVSRYSLAARIKPQYIVWPVLALSLLPIIAWLAGAKHWAQPGGVAIAHSRIGNECSKCHDTWHGPSQKACTECHLGPVHHDNQAREPGCVTCHAEHRGLPKLALVDNRECTQCHGALDSKGLQAGKKMNSANLAAQVTDFSTDHPQFALAVREQDELGRLAKNAKAIQRVRLDADGMRMLMPPSDQEKLIGFNKKVQGAIKLNHAVHLDGAKVIKSDKQPMGCADCHQPELDGKRMQKITFANHCATCHQVELQIKTADKNLPECSVPHGSEERVQDYLNLFFEAKRCEPQETVELSPRLLLSKQRGKFAEPVTRESSVSEIELYLQRDKGCVKCHEVDRDAKTGERIRFAYIPQRWFQHAEFTHEKHRFAKCEECHRGFGWRGEGAEKKLVAVNPRDSTKTEDMLVPGIETCRSCHRSTMWGTRSAATTNCSSCHLYHDKSKEVTWKGKMGLDLKPNEQKGNSKGTR